MPINNKDARPKKRKFKLTRQLVRMAINDGWTQNEIAKACRTKQSIVSQWVNGSKLGKEAQFKTLLGIYGSKLRRQSFKVYHGYNFDEKCHEYYRIEGKVIFSYIFFEKPASSHKKEKREKQCRIVVHDQGEGCFRLVVQDRKNIADTGRVSCSDEDGIWLSAPSDQKTCPEIIKAIEKFTKENAKEFPDEVHTLPFLIRKAFLLHGYPVEGIIDFPAHF